MIEGTTHKLFRHAWNSKEIKKETRNACFVDGRARKSARAR